MSKAKVTWVPCIRDTAWTSWSGFMKCHSQDGATSLLPVQVTAATSGQYITFGKALRFFYCSYLYCVSWICFPSRFVWWAFLADVGDVASARSDQWRSLRDGAEREDEFAGCQVSTTAWGTLSQGGKQLMMMMTGHSLVQWNTSPNLVWFWLTVAKGCHGQRCSIYEYMVATDPWQFSKVFEKIFFHDLESLWKPNRVLKVFEFDGKWFYTFRILISLLMSYVCSVKIIFVRCQNHLTWRGKISWE